jgi:hypothetical protein
MVFASTRERKKEGGGEEGKLRKSSINVRIKSVSLTGCLNFVVNDFAEKNSGLSLTLEKLDKGPSSIFSLITHFPENHRQEVVI